MEEGFVPWAAAMVLLILAVMLVLWSRKVSVATCGGIVREKILAPPVSVLDRGALSKKKTERALP